MIEQTPKELQDKITELEREWKDLNRFIKKNMTNPRPSYEQILKIFCFTRISKLELENEQLQNKIEIINKKLSKHKLNDYL